MSAFKSYKIKFPDVLRNCEDVLLDEELGIAYLSCDPGRDWWNAVMVRYKLSIDRGMRLNSPYRARSMTRIIYRENCTIMNTPSMI
jgi:hypothetical protein